MKTGIFLLLALTTLCCAAFLPQYYTTGQQILNDTNFSSGLEQWQSHKADTDTIIAQNGKLAMHSADAKTSLSFYQTIPNRFAGKKVQLNAVLRSYDTVAGSKAHHRARLLLVQYFGDVARYSIPYQVAALNGTNAWQEVSSVFTIAPDCSVFRVVVQMSHCSGEFFLKNLSLYQVAETSLYQKTKWLLRSAWVLFSFLLFAPYMTHQRLAVPRFLLLVTVAVILIGTTMPAELKNKLKTQIDSQLTTQVSKISAPHPAATGMPPQSQWQQSTGDMIDISKIAHFILFAFLVLLLRRSNPSRPVGFLITDVFMLACATEFSQFFIENRSPLLTDLLIDMGGAATGLLLANTLSLLSNFMGPKI